jgi:hypothetical protein
VEEREECGVSNVVVPRETVGHLVLFAGEPFREKDRGVVEQEFGGCTGDPEAERRRVGLAIIEARMVEPASRGGAVRPGEDDGTGWEADHHQLEGELDVAGEVFEGV